MPTPSLHPRPSWRAVSAEQLRTVGLATRRGAALVAAGLVVASLVVLLHHLRADRVLFPSRGAFAFHPGLLTPVVLLGVLLPLAVWRDEGPARRAYHWAMPVDRVRHSLLKVAIGWGWLLALLCVLVLWGLGAASLTGGAIGIMPQVVSTGDAWEVQMLRAPAWRWAVPFTAATVAYLFGSAAVLASDRPWSWFAGVAAGLLVAVLLVSAAQSRPLQILMDELVNGRFGLSSLVMGMGARPRLTVGPSGEAVVRVVGSTTAGPWMGATLLWGAVGLAGVLLAARRREG